MARINNSTTPRKLWVRTSIFIFIKYGALWSTPFLLPMSHLQVNVKGLPYNIEDNETKANEYLEA